MAYNIKDKILKELPALPETILLEIDAIISAFKRKSINQPGRFDDVFGTISEEEASDMLRAIDDCERVDANGW